MVGGSVQGPMANHHPDPASCHPKSSLAANSASITLICRCMYYPRECNLQKRAPPIKSPPCQSPPPECLSWKLRPLSQHQQVRRWGAWGIMDVAMIRLSRRGMLTHYFRARARYFGGCRAVGLPAPQPLNSIAAVSIVISPPASCMRV